MKLLPDADNLGTDDFVTGLAATPGDFAGGAPVARHASVSDGSTALYLQEAGDAAAISVNDINQGQIGDCFLLSSIGELALFDPSAIANMISVNPNGTETVALFDSASGGLPSFGTGYFKATNVQVTNDFYANGVNSGAGQDVVNGQKEIWVQVLEKACATLGGGLGSIANGGNPAIAMEELTGQAATPTQAAKVSLQMLQADVAAGDLITFDTAEASSQYNLVQGHAYMFEGLTTENGAAAVQLGNPWGFDQPDLVPVTQIGRAFVEVDVGHPAAPVQPVTTAVSIGGVAATQVTSDEAALHPFAKLTLSGAAASQTETATVAVKTPANGALSQLGGGSYNAATGVYSVTGTASAVTAALDGLQFTPTAHQSAPKTVVTTSLVVAIGGASATTSIAVTAVNDPPVIKGNVASIATKDTVPVKLFGNVSVVEPDAGQTLTATVTLASSAAGSLADAAGGNVVGGVYTVTGTASAVSAGLDGLLFSPVPNLVASGKTLSSTASLSVTDTAGAASPAVLTTVAVTGTEAVVAAGATMAVAGNRTIGTLLDNGTVAIARGGSLDVSAALDAASTGVFTLGGTSSLEFASAAGAGGQIRFLSGATATLVLDTPSSFGTGKSPTIAGFAAGDAIDIKGLGSAALQFSAAGVLQVGSATRLTFQGSSLGSGAFHAASDNHGGLLLTHS